MTHLISLSRLEFVPGDRMTREEFLERWERMPDLKFAKLIDGVVYMPSPLSTIHGHLDSALNVLFGSYTFRTRGCQSITNATWMMLESAPQPDIALCILPEYGGRTKPAGPYTSGAPELIVEISESSRSYGLGPKLALYQRAGVQEYVAALVEEQRIEWRILEEGSYRLMQPTPEGIFESRVFPGLWVDSSAFWRGDSAKVMEVLEQGLGSEEHAHFVQSLKPSL